MKILLTGGSGMLGTVFRKKSHRGLDLFFTYFTSVKQESNALRLDLEDRYSIQKCIQKVSPDIVIHAAAFTDIEYCEQNPERAFLVNGNATKIIAEQVAERKAKMIFISTDYVFDGTKKLYSESDAPNPLNVYGTTKLLGEKFVLRYAENLVIRTSIYGIYPNLVRRSFLLEVIHCLKSNKDIMAAVDQIGSQLSANDFVDILMNIINDGVNGVIHVGASDGISRYEFAQIIVNALGYDQKRVRPINHEFLSMRLGWHARRPLSTVLNSTYAQSLFGSFPSTYSSLSSFLSALHHV